MDLATQAVTVLVPAGFGRVSWSPDGSRIAFCRDTGGFLCVVEVQTGAVRQVTRGPGRDSDPAWSFGGGRIAFSRFDGLQSDVWVVGVEGGEMRNLTQHPAHDWAPAWIAVGSGG
ncbi:MAG: hypothetical protein AB1505_34300 [Candidatus Latescibacterota bacterium]